jgi:hypothetical protein
MWHLASNYSFTIVVAKGFPDEITCKTYLPTRMPEKSVKTISFMGAS